MKFLYITTIGITMGFFKDLIAELIRDGHTVDIATNERDSAVPQIYRDLGCQIYPIACERSPLHSGNWRAIRQIRELAERNNYDIIHCHTPVASMCTRLACRKIRKNGTKVFYTAHGFHFYKGAPLKNWLLYYPVEWLCAHFTDVLITINKEDYHRAQKHMHAKRVEYVPGVGVDLKKFGRKTVDQKEKRHELGIPEDAVLLLSVGEANQNKNHKVILRAMARLNIPKMHYMIAGVGDQMDCLEKLATELAIAKRFHLLGYRTDVDELYQAADIFCFPSKREGLGLAALEAMAYGLPLITSNVHGINDYSVNGVTGFKCNPLDEVGFADAIQTTLDANGQIIQLNNIETVKKYGIEEIHLRMRNLYNLS